MTTVNEVYSPVEQNLDKAEFIKIRSLVEKYPVMSSLRILYTFVVFF
jgi:hypothetical protein